MRRNNRQKGENFEANQLIGAREGPSGRIRRGGFPAKGKGEIASRKEQDYAKLQKIDALGGGKWSGTKKKNMEKEIGNRKEVF